MTDTSRQTKNERREQAREAARLQREKAKKRQSLLKWLIPVGASVLILAIGGIAVWAVFALQPPPKKEAGPQNMISDGIVFVSDGDGGVEHVPTPGIAEGEDPVPTVPEEGILNIVTFIDFSCPACRSFEETYGSSIQQMVASGAATLEVRNVAILDHQYTGRMFSTRVNNVAACVAEYAPERFLDVQAAIFAEQPQEGGPGLTNNALVDIVKSTGLDEPEINQCITGELFTPWVTSATQRSGVGGTPTVVINGTQWDLRNETFPDFVNAELAKLQG